MVEINKLDGTAAKRYIEKSLNFFFNLFCIVNDTEVKSLEIETTILLNPDDHKGVTKTTSDTRASRVRVIRSFDKKAQETLDKDLQILRKKFSKPDETKLFLRFLRVYALSKQKYRSDIIFLTHWIALDIITSIPDQRTLKAINICC